MKRILSYCAVLALVPGLAFAADTGSKSTTTGTAAPAAVSTGTKVDAKVDTKVDAGKKSEAPKSDAVKSDSAVTTDVGKKSEAAPVHATTVAKAKTAHHKAANKTVIKAKPADSNDGKVETPKT
jgi:hypothetical protein